MLTDTDVLRKIQPPFDFYWRPREPNFKGIDGLIRVRNNVRALQYTNASSHRSATNGLEEIYKVMNHTSKIKWHFDVVGPELSYAESARNPPKLTGRWAATPISSPELQLGISDKQILERVLNEVNTAT